MHIWSFPFVQYIWNSGSHQMLIVDPEKKKRQKKKKNEKDESLPRGQEAYIEMTTIWANTA